MKVILTASENDKAKKCQDLFRTFFENTGANELSEVLGLMLENYVAHAPVSQIDLANTVSLVNRLNVFFFNQELIYRLQADTATVKPVAVLVGDNKQCMPN